jgi:hypothetical protein
LYVVIKSVIRLIIELLLDYYTKFALYMNFCIT